MSKFHLKDSKVPDQLPTLTQLRSYHISPQIVLLKMSFCSRGLLKESATKHTPAATGFKSQNSTKQTKPTLSVSLFNRGTLLNAKENGDWKDKERFLQKITLYSLCKNVQSHKLCVHESGKVQISCFNGNFYCQSRIHVLKALRVELLISGLEGAKIALPIE